jgi:4-hydroxy-3-methylbut-2-enyl diphosphate reductase
VKIEIIKAEQAGFCFGVRRATQMACELEAQGHRPVYTLGPLMHNPQEVARLAKLGILPRQRIKDCRGGKTLIRTHGISLDEYNQAESLGIDLVDATCPHVIVPRRHMQEFGEQGRCVFLVGDRGHPEVQAMLSYAKGEIYVVSEPADIPDLPADTPVGLVAQTTQTQDTFSRLSESTKRRYRDTVAICTICKDTELRQEEGVRLASQVDMVIVVGGKSSANTCRLAAICSRIQERTFHVECASELEGISFPEIGSIGLLSGASTPDWIIAEVDGWLREKVLQKSLTR